MTVKHEENNRMFVFVRDDIKDVVSALKWGTYAVSQYLMECAEDDEYYREREDNDERPRWRGDGDIVYLWVSSKEMDAFNNFHWFMGSASLHHVPTYDASDREPSEPNERYGHCMAFCVPECELRLKDSYDPYWNGNDWQGAMNFAYKKISELKSIEC